MPTFGRITVFAVTVACLLAGCVPTVSMHQYRDVAVRITKSGEPVAAQPFRVVYGYSPADAWLYYHVELRTPDTVSAETDEKGKAIVELADYKWNIHLVISKFGDPDHEVFLLTEEQIRNGGARHAHGNPALKVELNPIGKAHIRKQRQEDEKYCTR
jgi:hypothetical protein